MVILEAENNKNNINKTKKMGNVQSAAESCASGVESSKVGIFTETTSTADLNYIDGYHGDANSHSVSIPPPSVASSQSLIEELSLEPTTQQQQPPLPRRSSSLQSISGSVSTTDAAHDERGGGRGTSTQLSSTFSSTKRITSPRRFFKRIRNRISNTAKGVEDFLFPHTPQLGASSRNGHHPQSITTRVRGGVLLLGCHTDEEHRNYTRDIVARLRPYHGIEGLKVAGLEYRTVTCDEDGNLIVDNNNDNNNADSSSTNSKDITNRYEMTRLFHAETNTMITNENRKQFVADGDMYDAVARLCQEYAQDMMIREANLEWHTVCEQGKNPEPIRALVSKGFVTDESIIKSIENGESAQSDISTPGSKPTLLIATGKGRVRAGIFSRQHLIISGVECSSALNIVREAVKREMNVVMVDPNVHGDRLGMVTFEKSMAKVFHRWEQPKDEASSCQPSDRPPLSSKDLFVLSHSQSGAQLARYLLDKSEHYLPHIRAVAFTDSTHNVQWTRENKGLHDLLQSPSCLYFRSSKASSVPLAKKNPLGNVDTAGKAVRTDEFFQHRFGKIKTLCAGTTEHSLTNFFAHKHIWGHFDSHLEKIGSSHGSDSQDHSQTE